MRTVRVPWLDLALDICSWEVGGYVRYAFPSWPWRKQKIFRLHCHACNAESEHEIFQGMRFGFTKRLFRKV